MNHDLEKSSGYPRSLTLVSPNLPSREAMENSERTNVVELDKAARQRWADKRNAFLFRPLNPEAA
jgi:hypothetical protein